MLFVASPWLLLIVSLSLILSVWLIRVSACSPWVYFVWESLCFLDLSECLLSHIRKFLTIISSNIFSCPLFSFWTTIMQVLEKALAPHSSTLIWKIPWMEEPGRLQSMGLLRVRHDWATSLSLSFIGEGNGNPLQHSCLENPRDGGAWWAAVYGAAQSQTRLKWLSSSSNASVGMFSVVPEVSETALISVHSFVFILSHSSDFHHSVSHLIYVLFCLSYSAIDSS